MPNVDFAKKSVVKVQQRSAFDKSFRNLLTTKCGTLTPILFDEVIPNTTVNCKLAMSCTLPPLASETFMNVNVKVEAFFCPTRLLMCGYEDFINGNTSIYYGTNPNSATETTLRAPVITLRYNNESDAPYIGNGTLLDYLGFRGALVANVDINAFGHLCYHEIWNEWYRNPLVQQSCFDDNTYYRTNGTWYPSGMKHSKPNEGTGYKTNLYQKLRDGVSLGALRQRNFGTDYFTVATPSPQAGVAQKVSMNLGALGITSLAGTFVSNGGSITGDFSSENNLESLTWNEGEVQGTGAEFYASIANPQVNGNNDGTITSSSSNVSFTISSLRAANSLQQFLERNLLSNGKFVDFLKVQYNADLKDSIAQRPVYLGSASFPVYSKGVYQTAADSNSGNNPFDSVGSRYGHAYSEGTTFIIDHYTAQEPGYIMILASLVPEVTYSGGVNKYLMRYVDKDSYADMPNPILQNVGPEPIRCYEFDNSINNDDSYGIFGYTDRFASMMTRNHELHGLLRDGASLESFALQRTGVTDGISDAFLQIPTNYMDQVTAVDSSISTYGCWMDCYFDYKVVMPLGKYVVPSLQDPAYEHGDTVVVNKRGRIME